jgi:hypothetical protein
MESEKFLRSLEHTNPLRPMFLINHKGYPMLEISHDGKSMQVPMAEILNFARRWDADYEAQREARKEIDRLYVFPYPLMNLNLNDPDVREVGWDCE